MLFVATLATSMVGNAGAQDRVDVSKLPAWMSELQAKRAEAGQAATEVSSAEGDMAPKKKEIALWNGELEKLRPLYADRNEKVRVHNEDAARQRAASARHKAVCPAKVPTRAQADRCNGELAPLNAWNTRITQNKVRLDTLTAQLDKRRDSMLQRRQQLVTDLQPMQARYDKAKAKLDAANQRIQTLQGWIAVAKITCAKLQLRAGKDDVGEALHYCNSIQWDNANPQLPPLTNPKPPFSATPNR